MEIYTIIVNRRFTIFTVTLLLFAPITRELNRCRRAAVPLTPKEIPMKFAKYVVLALALFAPVAAYAASAGCDCPCRPPCCPGNSK